MALVGYRNLAWLKARLLPADMGDESDYDADLSAIGLGVAAHFDRFTGRKLRRATGHVFETPADTEAVVVDCYPIEIITAAELVVNGAASNIPGSIINVHSKAGIVRFSGTQGGEADLIRLTITGGYWCQDGDDDELPEDATALPDELLNAWVQQCRAICEAENTFRGKGAEKPDKKTGAAVSLDTLTLLPGVQRILQLHTRQG
jgi:hypothetical protein